MRLRMSAAILYGALVIVGCTLGPTQHIAGGGVETGNTKAVGRVVVVGGMSVREVTVRIRADVLNNGTPSVFEATASPDDSGYYSFDSLPSGRYRISGVDSGENEGFTRTIAVVNHLDSLFVGVDSLRKVGVVKGNLMWYNGAGTAGITVGLRGTLLSQTVGGDGAFEFPRVPPGEQILFAHASSIYKGVPQLLTVTVLPGETTMVSFFLPPEHTFALNIFPGQVWSYKTGYQVGQTWQSWWLDSSWLPTYLNYSYVKDTLMNGLLFHVIKQNSFERGDVRTVFPKTCYLYVGLHADTVLFYESFGAYSIPALFKRASGAQQAGMADSVKVVYDTAAFSDFRIPAIFGIAPNSPWYSRPRAQGSGNLPLIQRYAGNEIVTVQGGTFNCMRMEWEWADSTPVKGVDYISDIGCVKQIIQDTGFFKTKVMDSLSFGYASEYIGTDTTLYRNTFPRIPQALYDSIQNQVFTHWNLGRYRRWLHAVDTAMYGSLGDVKNGSQLAMDALLYAVHPNVGAHMTDFVPLLDSLSAMPDTLTPQNVGKPEYLVSILLCPDKRNQLAQGWDDCDWDYRTNGIFNPNDTIAPYGRSVLSQSLFDQLNGYYLYIENFNPW